MDVLVYNTYDTKKAVVIAMADLTTNVMIQMEK